MLSIVLNRFSERHTMINAGLSNAGSNTVAMVGELNNN